MSQRPPDLVTQVVAVMLAGLLLGLAAVLLLGLIVRAWNRVLG